jgi:hypothetical protein
MGKILNWEYRITKLGCWVTRKVASGNGYPYARYNGKQITLARASYLIHYGGEIKKNQMIRHTCDNKTCVNPRHLLLGSAKDNTRDALERGLIATGERHHNAKITAHDVRAMFILRDHGYGPSYLAQIFGMGNDQINRILKGKAWKYSNYRKGHNGTDNRTAQPTA